MPNCLVGPLGGTLVVGSTGPGEIAMKIEQVLAEAPRVLSQEQREFYFENGYLLLESFIQNDEL